MKKILFCLVVIFTATTAMAANKQVQISLTPDIAFHGRGETIEGLALSIWGENQQSALSLGIVNGSNGQSTGLSLGLILNYADCYNGIHLAPANYTSNNFFGLQLGCVNYAGYMKGVQLGFINYVEASQTSVFQLGCLNYAGHIKGVQLGFINYAESAKTFGFQLGCVNYSGHIKGVQLGFINYAETAETGVQIGIVNIIAQNKKWFGNFPDEVAPGMVLVNWRF